MATVSRNGGAGVASQLASLHECGGLLERVSETGCGGMLSCNVCGWTGHSFEPLFDLGNVYCKRCGSYERHRALVHYLSGVGLPSGGKALDIGGGLISALRLFLQSRNWAYHSLDLWPGHGAICADIASLPLAQASFDLVICLHVLEHVHDDFSALKEIRRVTSDDGLAIIQVPYDDTRFGTRENQLPDSRGGAPTYHYCHKRDYGLDIIERLKYFWDRVVEINPLLSIPQAVARMHGFDRNFGTFFFCGSSSCSYPGVLSRNLLALKRRWLTERRAYEIHLSRPAATPLDNWLQAESELAAVADDVLAQRNVYEILAAAGSEAYHEFFQRPPSGPSS